MLEDAPGELSTLDKTVLDSLEAGTILSCQLEPALGRSPDLRRPDNRQGRTFGGIWPLILVFVGVLGGMDRHERLLRPPSDPYPLPGAVLRRHPAGANHHDEPAQAGNPEPLPGQNRISHQSEAELEIRQLHEKIDHQLARQWQRLVDMQQIGEPANGMRHADVISLGDQVGAGF